MTFKGGDRVIIYDMDEPYSDIYNGSGAAEVNSTDYVTYIETTLPDEITETVTFTTNSDGSLTKATFTYFNSTDNSTRITTKYLTRSEAYAIVDSGKNDTKVVDQFD